MPNPPVSIATAAFFYGYPLKSLCSYFLQRSTTTQTPVRSCTCSYVHADFFPPTMSLLLFFFFLTHLFSPTRNRPPLLCLMLKKRKKKFSVQLLSGSFIFTSHVCLMYHIVRFGLNYMSLFSFNLARS